MINFNVKFLFSFLLYLLLEHEKNFQMEFICIKQKNFILFYFVLFTENLNQEKKILVLIYQFTGKNRRATVCCFPI